MRVYMHFICQSIEYRVSIIADPVENMMSKQRVLEMSQERNQVYVTLSDRALEDYKAVAEFLNMPVATLLRQKLENLHQSPEFGAMLSRVRREKEKGE